MYDYDITTLDNGEGQRVRVYFEDTPLRYSEVIESWQTNEAFSQYFIAILADCPYSAFRWETPPVAASTRDREFRFVLLDDPWLGRRTPDTHSFSQKLAACDEAHPVATFDNLGGDATLVVPAGIADTAHYVDLASFSRGAPLAQQLELWSEVGAAMDRKLGDAPIWLNTAGDGVAWLHVRLDSRPKYYRHLPFTDPGYRG